MDLGFGGRDRSLVKQIKYHMRNVSKDLRYETRDLARRGKDLGLATCARISSAVRLRSSLREVACEACAAVSQAQV